MIAIAKAVIGSFKGVQYPNDKSKLLIDRDGNVCSKTYNLSSNNSAENWEEMKAISRLSTIKKKFLVAVLSPTADHSKSLKFDDWNNMAENYANEFGFAENQWRWDVHGNTESPHLHIYAARFSFSGRNKVVEGRIGLRSGYWAELYAKNLGWKSLHDVTIDNKNLIKNALKNALKKAKNFDELNNALINYGFTFQLSFSNNKDGGKSLNGMRIMTIADAEKRKKQEDATNLAVKIGLDLMSMTIRSKSWLTPEELVIAKELGKKSLSAEMNEFVLTKAEQKTKPGFTLSELESNRKERIKITDVVTRFEMNSKSNFILDDLQIDQPRNHNR